MKGQSMSAAEFHDHIDALIDSAITHAHAHTSSPVLMSPFIDAIRPVLHSMIDECVSRRDRPHVISNCVTDVVHSSCMMINVMLAISADMGAIRDSRSVLGLYDRTADTMHENIRNYGRNVIKRGDPS